ncbi:MAG: peptidase T [bacterium]|nr:peptidase T [bacterium]
MSKLVERFLKYVQIDTASDANSPSSPSTKRQYEFGKLLVEEMKAIGLSNVTIDEHSYVYAALPSNIAKDVPTIGFLAHMDVVADVPSANVKPRIIANYDGKDIVINEEKRLIMTIKEYSDLKNYVGQDLIVTDGTTLLGSDDKAGIAEILTAMEYLLQNPHIPHGTIKIAFTPDEEISRGTDHFDVAGFGADFAYTLDGGAIGGIEYETFNADSVKVTVNGKNIHPGASKNKMKNSLLIAMEFNAMLPSAERPAHTEMYEGFFHLNEMQGNVETSVLKYIIRDHNREIFAARKERIVTSANYLNSVYGPNTIVLEFKESYRNMEEMITPNRHRVETARQALLEVGIKPITTPVRGGTDGARLSFMGLPCPNLFAGGHNAHGTFEFVPIQSMEKAVEVILKIVDIYCR